MAKLLCKKCQNVQDGNLEDKKLECNRCGSNDLNGYYREIKLYWHCQGCDGYFKISDIVSKQLLIYHSNPECPFCKSLTTKSTLKKLYKKFSGQQQKHHSTKAVLLFETEVPNSSQG